MPFLLVDDHDVVLRRSVGGGKGGSTLHRNHAILKFDISSLVGADIDTAVFSWFLFNVTLNATDTQTIEARRYFNVGGADTPQIWTEATGAVSLVAAADWTATNTLALDSLSFSDQSTASVYYDWNIKQGLLDELEDGNSKFTICVTRSNFNVTGTAQTDAVSVQNGVIRSSVGGAGRGTNWILSEESTGFLVPRINYQLVSGVSPRGCNFGFGLGFR